MDRNIKTNGLVNLVALLVVGAAGAILSDLSHSPVAETAVIFLALGFLVAAVSYFQMRLEEAERLEKLELDELKKSSSSAALFTSAEADTFPARRSREQFERWLVPVFTVVLFLLQAGAAYWTWQRLAKAAPPTLSLSTITMAFYGLFALILFLFGKYSAGIARLEGQRLLRPGASYLLLGAYLCFLVTACIAAHELGFPNIDVIAARALGTVLALTALENLINLLLEMYRPRVKGQAARLLYESRLIGLLGQPEGLITTAAQALDYQFGFKVSETWFYRFLEKALAWLILLQLGVLLASTTFVVIEPNEQALLERFGQPVSSRAVLGPGFHFKWPWPIDKVYRYPAHEVQSFEVGVVHDPQLEKEKTVLWTKPHAKEEFNMLVATGQAPPARSDPNNSGAVQAVPVNLLTVSIPVQYQITNLVAWAYNHANAGELLEKLATREVVRHLVSVDVDAIMSVGRLQAAKDLRKQIQTRANEFKLGVDIVFVGLEDIHPPTKVANVYEEVIAAMHDKETNILAARAYAAEKVPLAQAAATNLINRAESDRLSKFATVAAEAVLFTNQMAAYKASPSVYANRAYLDTISRSVAPARKYVLATTNTQDSIRLNLEDKIRPDLLDVPLPADVKK